MNVIWNLTRICPWNCSLCCVSAIYVNGRNKELMKAKQKQMNKELLFSDKIKILNILAQYKFDVDFSGGDPLYYEEDDLVVKQATKCLPRKNINVSMTGRGIMNMDRIETLKKVDAVEITLDSLIGITNSYRPKSYDASSMELIRILVDSKVKVRAVTVLHRDAIAHDRLAMVYDWLSDNGVQEWSILVPCPVGRAAKLASSFPANSEYQKALDFVAKLNGSTKIVSQHTFGVLNGSKKCHAAIESIGILPDGKVTACAWALDKKCRPIPSFYLGKLPEGDLGKMLTRARNELGYSNRSNYCRIFSYIKEGGQL